MDRVNAPELVISRGRLVDNIFAVQRRIAPSELMVVMKDDAYGHGIEAVVDAITASDAVVRWFGGYDIPTSLRIRARAGTDPRVFAWATSSEDEARAAISADIDLGVGTEPYLQQVIRAAEALHATARVHLKIDTGLHRNGFRPEEWGRAVDAALEAERRGSIVLEGVWSHLAEASDEEDDEAASAFDQAVAAVRAAGGSPQALHLTASAASWWRPELRGTVSRIGAFCYGIRSGDGPRLPGVAPIASLVAPVVRVDGAGAEVGIGALDGLPTTLIGAEVGTPAGPRRITAVDASRVTLEAWADAAVGDLVHVFGPGEHGESDATTLGEHIGSIGEEILLRLSPRIRRTFVD
jgi:alanine racemase